MKVDAKTGDSERILRYHFRTPLWLEESSEVELVNVGPW